MLTKKDKTETSAGGTIDDMEQDNLLSSTLSPMTDGLRH
jgi:hypothetical protein